MSSQVFKSQAVIVTSLSHFFFLCLILGGWEVEVGVERLGLGVRLRGWEVGRLGGWEVEVGFERLGLRLRGWGWC